MQSKYERRVEEARNDERRKCEAELERQRALFAANPSRGQLADLQRVGGESGAYVAVDVDVNVEVHVDVNVEVAVAVNIWELHFCFCEWVIVGGRMGDKLEMHGLLACRYHLDLQELESTSRSLTAERAMHARTQGELDAVLREAASRETQAARDAIARDALAREAALREARAGLAAATAATSAAEAAAAAQAAAAQASGHGSPRHCIPSPVRPQVKHDSVCRVLLGRGPWAVGQRS